WKQALICQFTGELSKDGLCCVQPNFTLSLQDPHLLQAFVLCVQIKEVLPTVRTPSEETSSPNRDSAVKMMMMTSTSAPKAEQGETGIPSYVTTGDWPPKMAYTTTTSEEIQKGTPEFRADVSYLLLHSAQSSKTQVDKTRQLNYLIHWSTYAEKHFRRIEEQLQTVQANMEVVKSMLNGERKELKAQAKEALKAHSQNFSIRETSPYALGNRQKPVAYKDFYLMPNFKDADMRMFQNQRHNKPPEVKKHVISLGSEIPIRNIDTCPTTKVAEVIRLWAQHLHMVVT
ncbi:hypothetical protein EJ110_NYTH60055, partial [Nymphaea thermarum]